MMIQSGSPRLHARSKLSIVTVIYLIYLCILQSLISRPQAPKTPVSSRTSSVYVKLASFYFYFYFCCWCAYIQYQEAFCFCHGFSQYRWGTIWVSILNVPFLFIWISIWVCSMMPNPSKLVRFQKDSAPVLLKSALKKPEVVIPVWVGHRILYVLLEVYLWATANLVLPSLFPKAGTMKMYLLSMQLFTCWW